MTTESLKAPVSGIATRGWSSSTPALTNSAKKIGRHRHDSPCAPCKPKGGDRVSTSPLTILQAMAMAGHGRTVHFHTKIDGGTGRRSQLLHEYNHLSMMVSSPNPLETLQQHKFGKGKKCTSISSGSLFSDPTTALGEFV